MTYHSRSGLLPAAAAAAILLVIPGASHASLEEVIVTAQKREQNVQSVPIAVTALGEETIRNANILTIDDVANHTPGFTITNYNPVTPQPFIRGVGSSPSDAGSDASVGVFIDGVYAGRAGGYRADMFDLQRVEILRGPQGTLFGRNVAGGALNILSNAPTREFGGDLELTAGDYDLLGARGMLSGPLTDTLAARLAFSVRQRDGNTDNKVTGSELRDEDNQSVRGRLLWEPSEALTVNLIADYSEDDLEGPAARNFKGDPAAALDSVGLGLLVPVLLPTSGDPFKIEAEFDGHAEREMGSATLQLDWDTRLGTLTSVTGYRYNDFEYLDDVFGLAFDPASGVAPLLTDHGDEESDQFSQELRLTSVKDSLAWTVGLYYLEQDLDQVQTFAPLGFPVRYDQSADTTSYAIFAHATLPLNERWAVTAGGRYSYDEKDFDLVTEGVEIGFGLLTPDPANPTAGSVPFEANDDDSWSKFTPKISLEYTPNDDVFAYATWSQGYKSGGYNGVATNFTAATTPFDEETVNNYEVGLKTDLLNGRMRLNVAAFYMDYEDLQVFVSSFESTVGLLVDNAGEADVYGLEAEWFYAPNDRLDFTATYAYLDAEIGNNEIGTVEEGNSLTRAPEHSASAAAQYRWPIGDLGDLMLRADYAWQDKIYFQPENYELSAQDSYGLLHLRAALQAATGWELALWLKNATDEDYWVHAFDSSFGSDLGASTVQGEPRMWGVSGRYSW
jgi:iron complex outermembrane receptor protein